MQAFRAALLAVALSVPGFTVHAQQPTESSRSVSIGAFAGLSQTTMAGRDAADDLDRLTRPLVGLALVVNLSRRLQLEVDALYAGKGFSSKSAGSTFDFSVGYGEFPLLLRLNLAPNARVQPFIAAGGALGFRATCSANAVTPTGNLSSDCDEIVSGGLLQVNTTETSAVVGAGVEMLAGPARLTLGTRFTRGLTRVFANSKNHNEALSIYFSIAKGRQY